MKSLLDSICSDRRLAWRMPMLLAILAIPCAARAQVPGEAKLNIAHPLPPHAPPWLDGYQVRWPVRVLGDIGKQADAQTVLVRLPTGGWLKPDASDIAVQSGAGKVLPAAILSHDPLGDTIVQFARNGTDPWYWIYGVSPKGLAGPKADAKTLREGITLEVRDWLGTDLSSWAKVRGGLEKSGTVIGNAIVADVVQNCCSVRPDQSSKFAASYRGHLLIKKEGTYRFLLNADDASFLFIDGFKVFERAGVNRTLGTIKLKDLEKFTGKVDLKPGVHAFEIHQAVSDKPDATGVCALLWSPPGEKKFIYMPASAVAQPLFARAAALEKADGECPGMFVSGLDDVLEIPGIKLLLVRFAAQGPAKDEASFVWDFGDGTAGKGRSATHVYFKENDYTISLASSSGLPPFRRRIRVWAEPGENSPLSLARAVNALAAMEWKKLDVGKVRQIFSFLQVCHQPNRWPLLDAVAQHLLAEKDLDLEFRSQLYLARLEALTQTGKAADALKLAEQVRPEFAKTPALLVRIQIGTAAIHQYHYKDAAAASKLYKAILDENGRVEHSNLRLAGVRWGDLFAEAGDLVKASETYAIAATLGGDKFAGASTTDAATRGALLRIAEQKLRAGDIGATRQLLERLELEYPGRRIDGLYCYLRAESDRVAGRYEDALRYYEMIFKLPQWAGYRDRATHGIADAYLRMGELDKAHKWFANLKEAFPKFYETQKLGEVEKLLGERLERIAAAKAKGDPRAAFFTGCRTGLEPDETEWFGNPVDFAVVRAPAIDGSHAGLLDACPRELVSYEYNRPLKSLTPGATYWIEVWYQDLARLTPPIPHAQMFGVQAHLVGEAAPKPSTLVGQYMPRNTIHAWHKFGVKLKAPAAQDCLFKLLFLNTNGHVLVDRVSIQPVTDRQLDTLMTFVEGGKAP
jgi:tetratricopeptide (TPR) repeat protein